MSHVEDYVDYLSSLSDEEAKYIEQSIPTNVVWAQLWDLWDFVTWPIRKLRAALSPQQGAPQFTGTIDEVRVLGPMTAEEVRSRLAAHEAMEQPHEEGG